MGRDDLKIAFMTTLGVNVGDEFIREGIASLLDEVLESWTPYYVNKHDPASLYEPRSDESIVLTDKLRDADIVIQAGAPVYWKIGDSTSYSVEWAEELWRKRIFQLGPQKPILNIAAGACQPYGDTEETFLSDPGCVEFARNVDAACRWTSVRDPLASRTLEALGIKHEALPCTAFHAARRARFQGIWNGVVGVNWMPLAGHWKLREDLDEEAWNRCIEDFMQGLRKRWRPFFIAHDPAEKAFMERYRSGDEVIFYSPCWRDYLPVYAKCRAVISNRVHGAVCAAGFGRPSIIVGNDTRLFIGEYIGIPSLYAGEVTAEVLGDLLEAAIGGEKAESERLITLREESAARYRAAIAEVIFKEDSNSGLFKKLIHRLRRLH